MEINSDTRKRLIEFARDQMASKGAIDALIFTAKDITEALQRASDDLHKAAKDVGQALQSIERNLGE
jgi:hypothetical protein